MQTLLLVYGGIGLALYLTVMGRNPKRTPKLWGFISLMVLWPVAILQAVVIIVKMRG